MAVLKTIEYQDLEGIRVGRLDMGVNSSFIVYRLGATVIDTGPSNQWQYVKPFIAAKPLEQLILTHHHEDHSGNAARIKVLTGITPQAPELTRPILASGFKIPITQKVIWGSADRVEVDPLPEVLTLASGEPVKPLFTPGHAKDMTCYLLPERGWVFSADLYIANHLKFLRSDEHLPTLIDSIAKVLAEDFETLICPHRGVVEEGRKKLQEKYDYLMNLASDAQALAQQGMNVREITTKLLGKEGLMIFLMTPIAYIQI